MCFPRGAATPDVTIKLKLGDNMFGFCHRKRGGHDCAEARSCGGEGCPISKEMREAGLISLRRMKEGQKARIAHVQASGELGRRIRDMGLIPGAEVEVEYYNKDKKYAAPNELYVTQVVRADQNGVFAYGVPWAGWWGFAALNTAKETLDYKGTAKPIELGAVLWTNFAAPVRK